jgi:hypothetical protein
LLLLMFLQPAGLPVTCLLGISESALAIAH